MNNPAPSPAPTVPKWVWIPTLVAAAILAMTLPYKYSGHPDSVELFDTLGAGAPGRIASAVMETIALLLILVPRTAAIGGLLTMGIMGGAIMSHFLILGIVFQGTPELFIFANIALVAGTFVAFLRRRQLPIIGSKL